MNLLKWITESDCIIIYYSISLYKYTFPFEFAYLLYIDIRLVTWFKNSIFRQTLFVLFFYWVLLSVSKDAVLVTIRPRAIFFNTLCFLAKWFLTNKILEKKNKWVCFVYILDTCICCYVYHFMKKNSLSAVFHEK